VLPALVSMLALRVDKQLSKSLSRNKTAKLSIMKPSTIEIGIAMSRNLILPKVPLCPS